MLFIEDFAMGSIANRGETRVATATTLDDQFLETGTVAALKGGKYRHSKIQTSVE